MSWRPAVSSPGELALRPAGSFFPYRRGCFAVSIPRHVPLADKPGKGVSARLVRDSLMAACLPGYAGGDLGHRAKRRVCGASGGHPAHQRRSARRADARVARGDDSRWGRGGNSDPRHGDGLGAGLHRSGAGGLRRTGVARGGSSATRSRGCGGTQVSVELDRRVTIRGGQ